MTTSTQGFYKNLNRMMCNIPRLAQAQPMTDEQNTVRATLASPVSSLPKRAKSCSKLVQSKTRQKNNKRVSCQHTIDGQQQPTANNQPQMMQQATITK
jgi:hypothetical protein